MATTPGTTLLVIDESPETAESVRKTLADYQRGQFVVVGAADAGAALAALPDSAPPALALVFHRQGGADGLRAVAALRRPFPRLAVILVTDQRDFGALVHAMRLQVDDHIVREEALASALPRIIAAAIDRSTLAGRIEERRKAELFARRKADAVRELIVTVCHEFNNPWRRSRSARTSWPGSSSPRQTGSSWPP